MLETLKIFNYIPPKLKTGFDKKTKKFGSTGINKKFEIRKENECYRLFINNIQWMMYENDNHLQATQLFAHYYITSGDVIATGLGLAIREKWILNNPNIKSLTILEKNKDLIKYHKQTNIDIFKKANVINCDAKTYKGKCDTLLLDHYESETMAETINDVKNVCNNIECEKMWFWPLEVLILSKIHNVNPDTLCKDFRNNIFKINIDYTIKNIKNVYELIKNDNKLYNLPNLKDEELQLIITIYTQFFQRL